MSLSRLESTQEALPLRVFIAYRQDEGVGSACAAWLRTELQGLELVDSNGERFKIEAYLDMHAPAIADWREDWRAHLRAARALILVCTAEAAKRRVGQDWLHEELDWWLRHRKTSPLLIDVAGAGAAAVPGRILTKWPFAQRVKWIPESQVQHPAALKQITDGLLWSKQGVESEELRRLKWRSRSIAALTILVIALAVAGWFSFVEADAARRRAYADDVQAALQAHEDGDIATARRRLDGAPTDLRGWEWSHVALRIDSSTLTLENRSVVNGLAISPDGHHLAAAGDGAIRIYQLSNGSLVGELSGHRPGTMVAGRPALTGPFVRGVTYIDAHRLASVGEDGTTRVWHLPTQAHTVLRPQQVSPAARIRIAASWGGRWIASGNDQGAIDVWDLSNPSRTPNLFLSIPPNGLPVNTLAFSPDAETLTYLRGQRVWSLNLASKEERAVGWKDVIFSAAYSADGERLFGAAMRQLYAWTPKDAAVVDSGINGAKSGAAPSLAVDPSSGVVAYAASELITVLSPQTRTVVNLGGFTRPIEVLTAGGGHYVAASVAGTMKAWDLSASRAVDKIATSVRKVAVSADSRHLATIEALGNEVAVRDLLDGSLRRTEQTSGDEAFLSVAFSADGSSFVTGSHFGVIRRYRTRDAHLLWENRGPGRIEHIAVSSNAKWVASAGDRDDNTIRVWSYDDGRELKACVPNGAGAVAFSPDGTLLAAGGWRQVIPNLVRETSALLRVWQMPSSSAEGGRCDLRGSAEQREHTANAPGQAVAAVHAMSYSPDSRHIALATDSDVQIRDAHSMKQIHRFQLSESLSIRSVAFSPDGTRLAAAVSTEVLVWDTDTGILVLRLTPRRSNSIGWTSRHLILQTAPDEITILSDRSSRLSSVSLQ